MGHLRVSPPPPGGIFPLLEGRDIHECVSLVSFITRPRSGSGGAFYDYTARYGALRDEDKITLRKSLNLSSSRTERLDSLAQQLELEHLLDLPLVALSNGQTRRAKILEALLESPKFLVLDEPFSQFSFTPLWSY